MSKPLERYHDAVNTFKREYLAQMLLAHGGNRSRTARMLGLERTYLLRLIRDFQLREGASAKGNPALLTVSK